MATTSLGMYKLYTKVPEIFCECTPESEKELSPD